MASVIQTPSVSHMAGALDLNKSSPGSSSFYFDHSLGKIVYVNFSGPGATAKPTIVPGFDLSFSGEVTIRPFPGEPDVTAPGDNQTQQNTGNATATPGSTAGTPGPSGSATLTPDSTGNTTKPSAGATVTPGFEVIICLACITIAMIMARRKKG